MHPREQGCDCRAPRAGLLKEAIAEHAIEAGEAHVICDSAADLEAAAALPLPATLLMRNSYLRNDFGDLEKAGVAGCLYAAVQQLLRRDAVSWHEAVSRAWPGVRVTTLV